MNKWLLLLLCLCFSARAEQPLTSLTGETIALDDSTPVHLVFFDLWTAYGGEGPDKLVASLPVSYREEHRIVWVQPRFNVTDAQVHEFQQAMPAYRPLVVDENFQLMRRYGLWQTPGHVVVHNSHKVFSGSDKQLLEYLAQQEEAP